jgi:hypothetical protein
MKGPTKAIPLYKESKAEFENLRLFFIEHKDESETCVWLLSLELVCVK